MFFERYDIEKQFVLLYWEPFPFLAMAGQRTGRSRFGFKMVLLAVLWCALHPKDLKAYQTLVASNGEPANKIRRLDTGGDWEAKILGGGDYFRAVLPDWPACHLWIGMSESLTTFFDVPMLLWSLQITWMARRRNCEDRWLATMQCGCSCADVW